MSEIEKFVADLPTEDSEINFEEELKPESHQDSRPESVTEETEETPAPKKDSRWKKMRVELREAREELERLKNAKAPVSETKNFADDTPPEWLAMYGDNEDSRKAWTFQKNLFDKFSDKAKQDALKELQSQREREAAEEKQMKAFIASSIEAIEEDFDVDLSSNAPSARKARVEFLDLVERLSPKDANGEVSSLADFHEVWNLYQSQRTQPDKTVSQQKSLAARGMTKSTDAPTPKDEYEEGMGFDGIRQRLGLN